MCSKKEWIPNFTEYSVRNKSIYKPNKRERNYAHLAFSMALKSRVRHGKHCAILYNNRNEIVSIFVNEYNFVNGKQCSIHAEQGVIDNFRKSNPMVSLSDHTIMVIRGNIYGEFTMSKPCIHCYKCISESGIKRIIYSSYGVFSFERIILE
jgi:deoxycytidylate deaminase